MGYVHRQNTLGSINSKQGREKIRYLEIKNRTLNDSCIKKKEIETKITNYFLKNTQ